MSIATKTGDRGSTRLLNGDEVRKDCLRTDLLGSIDELNCQLGAARAVCGKNSLSEDLLTIQRELIDVDAAIADPQSIASPQGSRDFAERASVYERRIAALEREIPPVSEFRIPGSSELEAGIHLARAVSRRCERRAVRLHKDEDGLNEEVLAYFNRLADYLWLLARKAEVEL